MRRRIRLKIWAGEGGEAFLAQVAQVFVPTLKPRDIVVMDTPPAHKPKAEPTSTSPDTRRSDRKTL